MPLSYKLHAELAAQHGGEKRWGYRRVNCGEVEVDGVSVSEKRESGLSLGKKGEDEHVERAIPKVKKAKGVPEELDWVENVRSYEEMGGEGKTAQVHPRQFTQSIAELAQEQGAEIVYGSATGIDEENGTVKGVRYQPRDGEEKSEQYLSADTIILTAGPWTRTVYPRAPISAMRAHSVTIRPSQPVSAHCLFTSIRIPSAGKKSRSKIATPEIYARPNNEVYACGDGDALVPLPTSTDLVQVDPARCQAVIDEVSSISPALRDGEVTARQACYLPNVSGGGGPLIGETGVKGLLIGAGHTCWGIQNAPGTGKCLAELVWEGKIKSARLAELDPKRFM